MKISGRKLSIMPKKLPNPPLPLTVMGMAAVLTPALSRISTRLEPASLRELRLRASVVLMVSLSPSTSMLRISPPVGHLHHLGDGDVLGAVAPAGSR